MHPDVFDAIADSLGMAGSGRDAAKEVLTAEIGTLSAAARRNGISRPAVARQVKRVEAAVATGELEVTLTLSVGELDMLFRCRDQGNIPCPKPSPSIVTRAEQVLEQHLGMAREPTQGAAFFGTPGQLLIVERDRSTAIHAWSSHPVMATLPPHDEIEVLFSDYMKSGRALPAHTSLQRQQLVTGQEFWVHLRIHSLTSLKWIIRQIKAS